MTATIEEIDSLEGLDFKPECDIESCEREADWIVTFSCCLTKHFYCDKHLRDVREHQRNGYRFYCPVCHIGDIIEPFAEVDRLK